MSGTDQTAATLFRAGKLDDAVAAAQAALRKAPTDLNARVLLGELLAFSGSSRGGPKQGWERRSPNFCPAPQDRSPIVTFACIPTR